MSDDVKTHAGESDMVTFEVEGKPDPALIIEQVGDDPDIRYRYEWDERGEPTPEQFERVGHLEVKLVTMMNDLEGNVQEQAEAVHDELVALKKEMCYHRDLDDEASQQVMMGNLDALPEVEVNVE